MPELVNHAHCKICGRATRFGQETCSDECAATQQQMQKKRSRTVLIFYAAVALMMVLLMGQLLGNVL